MDSSARIAIDTARLRAVQAGDESAWREWYDEAFEAVDAYALWRCGGLREEADDVLQEAWLAAVRRISHYDPRAGPLAGWLCGIVAGLLRNRFRKERRRGGRPLLARPDAEPADAEALRREQALRVAEALASLPGHYESVLRLKYLEGLSVAEIAQRRGESARASESLLTRAREAFRSAWSPEETP